MPPKVGGCPRGASERRHSAFGSDNGHTGRNTEV